VNTFPGLVHTARHTTKVGNARSRWPNHLEGAVEGGARDWGEVVSKLRPPLVTAGEKLGCLLETPSIRRYHKSVVKMRPVRTISREVGASFLEHALDPSETTYAELLDRR
jgi:hypothetical protein